MNGEEQSVDTPAPDGVAAIRAVLEEYPGHAEPEQRRVCDESLRAHLLQTVGDFVLHLASLESHLAKQGQREPRARVRQAAQRLELLHDKVQSAPYAFSPFFTVSRLPDEVQQRMTDRDRAVLDSVQAIEQFLEPTMSAATDFSAIVDSAFQAIGRLDEQIESRLSAIMEFQG